MKVLGNIVLIDLTMPKKMEVEQSTGEQTKKFIEKYWPTALAVAGAAGAIGGAIWLTARYLREKKNKSLAQDNTLKNIETEVEMTENEGVVLLETGTYLGDVSGEEGKKALMDLASQMDDDEAVQALELLREVIEIGKKK